MNGLVSHQLTVKYLKATSRSEAYLSLIRKLLCKDTVLLYTGIIWQGHLLE